MALAAKRSSYKHSFEEATDIQRKFEETFARKKGVVGIGIGLNSSEDDLALNVQVSRPSTQKVLPSKFDGMEVVVDVVGEIEAY